ncbi:MAG: pyridoxal phosphate-dependent aminotransferase [DPANN group archaeon]|nr:pyridoxal phosphate-dependent aminotransferase [DPANN group archaeon]
MITNRIASVRPSATIALTALAKRMKAEGKDVLSFCAGEPDFSTPEHIKEAAKKAIDENFSYYTPAAGIDSLRTAIAAKLKRENRLDYGKDQVIVTNGGKHALYSTYQTLLNPGDEAIIISPYWVSYREQIQMAEAVPVVVESDDGFGLDLDLLRKAWGPKTRLVTLNSPSNPSGAVLDRKTLQAIADQVLEQDGFVISDEVYEHFLYDRGQPSSIASLGDEIKEKTITINSVSKTYAMTGWRIGWSASNGELAKAMGAAQSHTTSNPNSIAQKAAVAAYEGPQESVKQMRDAFDERRKYMVKRLNEMEGVSCSPPKGAFYCFPEVKDAYPEGIRNSMEFCKHLLDEARLALVPGSAFGREHHVRISYAASREDIEKGMDRLERFLGRR